MARRACGDLRLLKSAALFAAVVLTCACAPQEMEAGCGPSETSEDGLTSTSFQRSADAQHKHRPNDEAGDESKTDRTAEQKRQQPTVDTPADSERPRGTSAVPERPWAHNTGPSDAGALKPSGSVKITSDGAVLENVHVSGSVKIDADNVTMRNFRIEATSHYGIRIVGGHRGIVLEHGEIYGMRSAAILGVGFTARHLYVHDGDGDGLKVQGTGGPTIVESCFIEKLGRGDGAHADGNQTRGGSNITFRYNNIYMPYSGTAGYPGPPYKSNATFMLQGKISNFVIERNWLAGGNYTIYSAGGVSVRNNIFGRENGGLAAGKEDRRIRNGRFDEWSGNRWEDTGGPI
jgi:hypothetical protein